MAEIIVACITGGLSLIGVIFSNKASGKKIEEHLNVKLAVMDTRLEELTREVREHNNFAKRMPVVENEISHIETDIKQLKEYHS